VGEHEEFMKGMWRMVVGMQKASNLDWKFTASGSYNIDK
jgi:hypothetical protein